MNTLTKTEDQKTSQNPQTPQSQRVLFVTPPANILETAEGYILEAEMPGVGKDGLEITVENGELTILGHRTRHDLKGRELFRETRGLDYRRVFELDPSIESERIQARMEQGLLTMTLPKAEKVKPRKIKVA